MMKLLIVYYTVSDDDLLPVNAPTKLDKMPSLSIE